MIEFELLVSISYENYLFGIGKAIRANKFENPSEFLVFLFKYQRYY